MPGLAQPAGLAQVALARLVVPGQFPGQRVDPLLRLAPQVGKKLSGSSIAANRPGSHRAQCLRAISPYWFTVVGSLLSREPRQHVLHQAGRGCPVPLPDRTGPP